MPFCTECGNSVDGKFCSACGHPVISSASAPSKGLELPSLSKGGVDDQPVATNVPIVPVATAMVYPSAIVASTIPFDDGRVGAPSIRESVMNPQNGPRIVLVKRGSPHELRFSNHLDLKRGKQVSASLSSHQGVGIGRCYEEERRSKQWRYTESCLGEDGIPIYIEYVDNRYLKVVGADLVFDVSFWNLEEGNTVNYVGGTGSAPTRLPGGGRDWDINQDGSISCRSKPDLVLGAAIDIPSKDLEGCYGCYCFPCGSAVYNISAKGNDDYQECGIFWFCGILPLIYGKHRRRNKTKGPNTFVTVNDEGDVAGFFRPGVYNPGPFKSLLCGGRMWK